MRVYYLTNASHAINDIALKRIKISRILDLNDPYELLGVNRLNHNHRKGLDNYKNKMHERDGLICFSAEWGNPVLWSHYGDRHKGICLGFDIPDKILLEVKYRRNLIKMDLSGGNGTPILTEEFARDLLVTKYVHWKYEREYRVFFKLNKKTQENGNYFIEFNNSIKLKEVIVGHRCELSIQAARDIVVNYKPIVLVKKARAAYATYRIIENKSATKPA